MTEIQKTIAQYVLRSAGTCNHLTKHTLLCFVGMIETGEADIVDFGPINGLSNGVILITAAIHEYGVKNLPPLRIVH